MIIKPEQGNPLVLKSDNVYHRRLYLLGTKAKNLCLASIAGAPVPDFRVLSSEAFFLLLRHNHLRIGHLGKLKERTKELAEIRERIIGADVPPTLEGAILDFIEKGGKTSSFAVRLSYYSPVELAHPPHFYRLNLKIPRLVIDAVKRSWAACFSELFFHPELFDTQCVNKRGPAVIIQHMINGSVSGVFYSQSPGLGEEDLSLLACCKGLGLTIKDGRENVCIEKIQGGSVVERDSGSQKSYYTAAGKDGTQILEINNAENSSPIIRKELREEIISWGSRLNFLSKPVILTWTIYEDTVFILGQTFYCKTAGKNAEISRKKIRGERVWSDEFTSSLFPVPISPLACSLWYPILEKNWGRKIFYLLKVKNNKDFSCFRVISSRPYIDEFLINRLKSLKLSQLLVFFILKTPSGLLPDFAYRRFRKKLAKFLVRDSKKTIKNKNSAELMGRIKNSAAFLDRFSFIYFFTLIKSIVMVRTLEKLLKFFFGGKYKRVMLVLLGKSNGGIYAKARENIEHISCILWNSAKFQDFLKSHKKRTFQEILREDSMGMPFLRACCGFNQKFGWLTESADVSMPPLEERAGRLFDLCSLFQRQKELVKAQETLLKRSKIREKRYAKIVNARFSKRLPGAGKIFLMFLDYVRKSVETLENGAVFLQKLFAGERRIFLELGERLVDLGKLGKAEDIFFLRWDEVKKAFLKESFKKYIPARKKVFAGDKLKYRASKYVEHGNHLTPSMQEDRTLIYQGRGTSYGCAVAPLAVRAPGEPIGDICGKILLTTALNREWDFNVLGARGIITESGIFSGHAAYIARQYGIPAVSDVPGLLPNMRDGDIVYLNAFDGIVELLHPASFVDANLDTKNG